MELSKLIKKLQEIEKEHGNITVINSDGYEMKNPKVCLIKDWVREDGEEIDEITLVIKFFNEH